MNDNIRIEDIEGVDRIEKKIKKDIILFVIFLFCLMFFVALFLVKKYEIGKCDLRETKVTSSVRIIAIDKNKIKLIIGE